MRHCVYMNGTKLSVLVILCLQNSLFTVLRRYSQGILKEDYSKVTTKNMLYQSYDENGVIIAWYASCFVFLFWLVSMAFFVARSIVGW